MKRLIVILLVAVFGFQSLAIAPVDRRTRMHVHAADVGRAVAQAALDVGGVRVNVFVTHLDSGDRPENRAVQVAELRQYLGGFAAPRVVAAPVGPADERGAMRHAVRILAVERDTVPVRAVPVDEGASRH